jgi:hypothetical protein
MEQKLLGEIAATKAAVQSLEEKFAASEQNSKTLQASVDALTTSINLLTQHVLHQQSEPQIYPQGKQGLFTVFNYTFHSSRDSKRNARRCGRRIGRKRACSRCLAIFVGF